MKQSELHRYRWGLKRARVWLRQNGITEGYDNDSLKKFIKMKYGVDLEGKSARNYFVKRMMDGEYDDWPTAYKSAPQPKEVKNIVYTYLITDGLYYKIGKSIDPLTRLRGLTTGNPNCKLLFYGNGRTEKQLHDIFKSLRVKGEWFNLKHWHVELISRLLQNATTGEDLLRCYSLRSAALREKEYDSFVIKFGKYDGRFMSSMNSPEEIKYLEWVQTWRKIDTSHPVLLRAINMHLKKHIKHTA